MPEFEDFSTYTEDDANGKLTVTSTKATAVNCDRDEDVFLYFDQGASFYNGLKIDFEIFHNSDSVNNNVAGMAISNTVGSITDFATTDVSCTMVEAAGTTTVRLVRGNQVDTDTYTASDDTIYYCRMLRAAASDTITLEIYSDSGRSTLLDTLTLSSFGTGTRYRYKYGFVNFNSSTSGADWDGYIENMVDHSTANPTAGNITMTSFAPTPVHTTKPTAADATMASFAPSSVHTAKPSSGNITMVGPAPTPLHLSKPTAGVATMTSFAPTPLHTAKPSSGNITMVGLAVTGAHQNTIDLFATFRDTSLIARTRDTTLNADKRDTSFRTKKKES